MAREPSELALTSGFGRLRSYTPGQLARAELESLPDIVLASGPSAPRRFVEFFAAQIRNKNTRIAYAQAVGQFLDFAEQRGVVQLRQISPLLVSAYIEGHPGSVPTQKQHLAAIRHLCDWLVTGHVLDVNPAASVRGPRYVVDQGKTPILSGAQVRQLLDSIPTTNVVGLRDRALIAVLFFVAARISAALHLAPRDLYREGRKDRIRLHEKGGVVRALPLHHEAREHLARYLEATGLAASSAEPLFRAVTRARVLTERPLLAVHAWHMIRRRARAAGIDDHACCHTFRATAITLFRRQGGTLEMAQRFAGHREPKTTLLYDRSSRELPDAEVERIQI